MHHAKQTYTYEISHDHLVGDYVFKETADTLRQTIRFDDFICYWGGEEFVIVVCNCDAQHLMQLAKKIRTAIQTTLYNYKDSLITVTSSTGAAARVGCENVKHMTYCTDKTLSQAKQAGCNLTI